MKLTQKELAKKINKSERMLQKYENGEVVPSIEVLQEIAKVLNLPSYAFIINEEEIKRDLTNMKDTEALLNYLGYEVISYPIAHDGEEYEIEIKSKNDSIIVSQDQYEQLKGHIKFILDYELYKLKQKGD